MIRSQKIRNRLTSNKINERPLLLLAIPALIMTAVWLTESPVKAEIYKWVDDTGRIQYSEIPPASRDSQLIVPRSSPVKTNRSESNEKPRSQSVDQKDQKLNEPVQKVQITEDIERIRKKNCAAATQNLKTLQSRGQIKLLDGDEYRILSSEEREAKISLYQKHIEKYCD